MQKLSSLIISIVGFATASCNPLEKLRTVVHGNPAPPAGAATVAPGLAGLSVTVDPPAGISILLDDVKVSDQSPYLNVALEPGLHALHVRGMGYLSITLPLVLKKQEILKVPVSLRPRPQPRPAPEPSAETPVIPRPVSRASPPPPPRPVDLPADMAPLELQWLAQPPVPAQLDGKRLEAKTMRLRRQSGVLQVGPLSLAYAVNGAGVVEVLIPDDTGAYWRDGIQQDAGAVIRLTRAATRIRRAASDGSDQSVVLKRLN